MAATASGGGDASASAATAPSARLLPNFLIIGAQKAGTTALFYALSKHPQVFTSAIKEPRYFANEAKALADAAGPGDGETTMTSSLEEYEALFAEAGAAIARGEASPAYLYDAETPAKIAQLIPDAKLIAILRNPIERAYSNFLYLIREGREPLHDFGAALAEEEKRRASGWSTAWFYKDKGFYGVQLERYLEHFDRDQLHFILYEDYNENPESTVKDVYRFLGVDESFTQDLSIRLNVSGLPKSKGLQAVSRRSRRLKWLIDPLIPDRLRRGLLKAQNKNLSRPPLPPEVRAELIEEYREDIERVGELTGLDVSRWLETGSESGK
jgi:Sulfotransferase family